MVLTEKQPGNLQHRWRDQGNEANIGEPPRKRIVSTLGGHNANPRELSEESQCIDKLDADSDEYFAQENAMKESEFSRAGLKYVGTPQEKPITQDPIERDENIYNVALKKVKAECRKSIPASEKTLPAYAVPLKRVSMGMGTQVLVDMEPKKRTDLPEIQKEKLVPKSDFGVGNKEPHEMGLATLESKEKDYGTRLEKAPVARTRPGLLLNVTESTYKIDLKRVDMVEKPITQEGPYHYNDAPHIFSLKKVELKAQDIVLASEKEEVACKMELKRVETLEKLPICVSTERDHQLYGVALKKVEAGPRLSLATIVKEPSYKIGLKKVDTSEKPITQETPDRHQPVYKPYLKKVGLEALGKCLMLDKIEAPPQLDLKHMTASSNTLEEDLYAPKKIEPVQGVCAIDEQSEGREQQSAAQKELDDLRALGLTKMLSTKRITRVHERKEDEELQALRSHRRTNILVMEGKAENDDTRNAEQCGREVNDDQSSSGASSKTDSELRDIRALALTKSLSKRTTSGRSGSGRTKRVSIMNEEKLVSKESLNAKRELEELRLMGLTKALSTRSNVLSQEKQTALLLCHAVAQKEISPSDLPAESSREVSKADREIQELLLQALRLAKAISHERLHAGTKVPSDFSAEKTTSNRAYEEAPTSSYSSNRSRADKELQELRSLGLTKAISRKSFAADSNHDLKNDSSSTIDIALSTSSRSISDAGKEVVELKLLWTTKKVLIERVTGGCDVIDWPDDGSHGKPLSAAEKELAEIRALGLTKTISQRRLSEIKSSTNILNSMTTGVPSGDIQQILAVESEDIIYEDESSLIDENRTGIPLSVPSADDQEQARVNCPIENTIIVINNLNGKRFEEDGANNDMSDIKRTSTGTIISNSPEKKVDQKISRRRETKEKFKGVKRLICGKK